MKAAVEAKILDLLTGESGEKTVRETFKALYRAGQLDDRMIDVELPSSPARLQLPEAGGMMPLQEILIKVDRAMGGRARGEKKRMKARLRVADPPAPPARADARALRRAAAQVSECRPHIEEGEFDRMINQETVVKEAIAAVEQDGIVFIDEIDKIVSSAELRHGADASSEGVQRDLLPIIEGSTISTKRAARRAPRPSPARRRASGAACVHLAQARQREHGPHFVHRLGRLPQLQAERHAGGAAGAAADPRGAEGADEARPVPHPHRARAQHDPPAAGAHGDRGH